LKRPELFFDIEKCAGCGKCIDVCPNNAILIKEGRSWTDRSLCHGSGECATVCPNDAREIIGQPDDPEAVFNKVMADEIFYQHSGGGVTVSGGEPLFQPEFLIAFLKRCKAAGLHTTVDTSGYAEWQTIRQVLKYVDLLLYDLKHMDPAEHLRLTSVSNQPILENARRIYHELDINIEARTSVVPGFNDTVENIAATARFIAEELSPSVEYRLLPYHKFGEAKQERLEWGEDRLFTAEVPDDDHMAELKCAAESFGLTVHIGG
jgi:pyruvate formate lyase activating enzyme